MEVKYVKKNIWARGNVVLIKDIPGGIQTGMRDAAGHEIFRSDILQDTTGKYYFVDYNKNIGAFVMIGRDTIRTFDENMLKDVKVVGNIYDNRVLVWDSIDRKRNDFDYNKNV